MIFMYNTTADIMDMLSIKHNVQADFLCCLIVSKIALVSMKSPSIVPSCSFLIILALIHNDVNNTVGTAVPMNKSTVLIHRKLTFP